MAIYFKNGVTKRWVLNCNENDPDNANIVIATPICYDEKNAIRPILLKLLVSSDDLISKQIIESLHQIFNTGNDFVRVNIFNKRNNIW